MAEKEGQCLGANHSVAPPRAYAPSSRLHRLPVFGGNKHPSVKPVLQGVLSQAAEPILAWAFLSVAGTGATVNIFSHYMGYKGCPCGHTFLLYSFLGT